MLPIGVQLYSLRELAQKDFVAVLKKVADIGYKLVEPEVESVVLRFPGIAECACFAKEDRMGGCVPKLNIVTERNKTVDTKELRKFMAGYLESYKIPKLVEIVSEIPKTANGKTDRKKLV